MPSRPASHLLVGSLAAGALLLALACSDGDPTGHDGHDGLALTTAQRLAVAQVRAATDRYRDLAVAQAGGYTAQFPAGCAASSEGGQGYHYLNESLVDATIELLKPELVMYEPQADGSLVLVGVDYVVPFDAWSAATPPTLLGVPFLRNEPLGVWALHIWAQRENPRGTFAAWNPGVSCAHAD